MGTALQRIGQTVEGSTGSGVSNDDPDLVAYWTFDEGRGYVVHDVTQRGHDLYLTSEPHWEVSSYSCTTGPCACWYKRGISHVYVTSFSLPRARTYE